MAITAAFMMPHPPLIIPEIGKGGEQNIQATIDAYGQAAQRIARLSPETIVLISPHQVMYADYFHISPGAGASGDFGSFGAAQVTIQAAYDTDFVNLLCGMAQSRNISAGTLGERDPRLDHGTMVPLSFVDAYRTDYKLVRIGLSGLSLAAHYDLGTCVQDTADALGRRIVVIASGDLSHRLLESGPYGFREEGPLYDRRIMDVMERGAFEELFDFSEGFCEKAGECGHRSFAMMAGALNKKAFTAKRYSYEGPFGVGYGICGYEVTGSDAAKDFKALYQAKEQNRLAAQRAKEDCYVRLARDTIETFIRTGEKITTPDDLPKELYETQAGVFVSIKKDGGLRGCIGTIRAVQASVAEEIIQNAISAATQDPRFSPVLKEELPWLSLSVDVLGDAERIDSEDALDVKRYGVIVTNGSRRGLLLPNLDGVDTAAEQVAIAKRKAGILEHENVLLERFEVVRHF